MQPRHLISLLTLLVSVLLFTACGGSGTTLDTPQVEQPAATTSDLDYEAFKAGFEEEASTEGPLAGLPPIPLDEGEADKTSSAAGDITALTVLGSEFLMQDGGTVDGTSLILEGPGDDEQLPSYGLYQFSGLLGKRPLSLNIEGLLGGLDQGYFVGVADYTSHKWQWFGPVTFPEFELDLYQTNHQLVTHLGNMYFLIAVGSGNTLTHSQTTVILGEPDPGDMPGGPHHLVASDGQVPEGIALNWMPGNGAEGYQVFRRALHEDAEWEPIGATHETRFLDEPLPDYMMFAYRVRGVSQGGESGFSNVDTGFAGGGEDPCAIRGQLTSWNGEPVPGVIVGLVGMGEEMLRHTNPEGKFYFGDLPPGEYLVAPFHPELVFAPEYHAVHVTMHDRFADLHFNAVPEDIFHRVGGFVVTPSPDSPSGVRPLPGTLIYCENIDDPDLNFATMSNQHGFWLLTDLPEGVYFAVALKEGFEFVPNVIEVVINGHNPPDRHDFIGLWEGEGDPPPPPPGDPE